jgi:thiamine biosynthesis lipoprotein
LTEAEESRTAAPAPGAGRSSGLRRAPVLLLGAGLAALLLVCVVALARTRGRGDELFQLENSVMKTGFLAKAAFPRGQAEGQARAALEKSLEAARRVERLMSRFLPESDVSRLAAAPPGSPVRIDPDTLRVLELARDVFRRSGGAFDVTVGPLVRLYRYDGEGEPPEPSDEVLAEARARVGSDKLLLDADAGTASLAAPGMNVDLSAVAKGFAVDAAVRTLQEAGAAGGIVEIGGEVRAWGRRPGGGAWRVGVRHPRARRLAATLAVSGGAVATSGDYEKHFARGPRQASHIIDPRTGRPLVGGAVGVTVLAPECALADALATAMSVLGPRAALDLAAGYRRRGCPVEVMIFEEREDGTLTLHVSPGLADVAVEL